ncbi:MAG: aspartate kinase [Parachlamydiaceae bacterium]|nr:aspartate kinase [Parachlamydiaceae bacterium]
MEKTLVMKFGGASVATVDHFASIATLITQQVLEYSKIIVVVSAMGDTTDELIAMAKKVHPSPPKREYDMLITVGERISISLLAMALALKNQEACSFTGSQTGIITCSRHSDARILDVRPHRILPHLNAGKIAIIAGFQGVSEGGEITTLGRGGSDTSAVALGVALNAEKVVFFKDVEGLYAEDPKLNPSAKFHDKLDYEQALSIASNGFVLHPRCIVLAQKNELPLQIRSFNQTSLKVEGTWICGDKRSTTLRPIYEELEM